MLFNSYGFVFIFFPLCTAGFYLCRALCLKKGHQALPRLFLLLASLCFYGFSGLYGLLFLAGSMVLNYALHLGIIKGKGKKQLLFLGVSLNLLALFVFKYTGLFRAPLGISFFTFTQIAFLAESCRDGAKRVKVLDFGVYTAFFPKLAEGPIALPAEIFPQLSGLVRKKFEWEGFYRSLCLFVLGLAKKVLIADTLGKAVNFGYADVGALRSGEALIVMLSYTLQLYFDFSGYCDMAMGIAGCLGLDLPLNFDSPYKAGNIIEFWKGWHITLTRFFTRYLYIPLGGNRKGQVRTYCNILLIFLVSGIWHGKGPQFLIWGLLHGVLYVITRWRQEKKKQKADSPGRLRKLLCTAATFLYVNIAWVFFRAPSVKDAMTLLKTMISCRFARFDRGLAGCFQLDEFWYVIKVLHIDGWQYSYCILMAAELAFALGLVFFAKTAVQVSKELKPRLTTSVIMAVLFTWCVLGFSQVSTFLYFNF